MTTTVFRHRETGAWPFSELQLRLREKQRCSFGNTIDSELADMLGYDTIRVLDMPAHDPDAHRCIADEPQIVAGEWRQGWTLVAYTPLELSARMAEAVANTIAAAERTAAEKRNLVVAGISPAEMAGWSIKRAEALAWQASGQDTDAPSLVLEAQARGVPLADLVGKVLGKAQALAALEAGIAGRCGAIQDAARAATTFAELRAIDPTAGWPV